MVARSADAARVGQSQPLHCCKGSSLFAQVSRRPLQTLGLYRTLAAACTMTTLAESFLADLDDLSDASDHEQGEQPEEDDADQVRRRCLSSPSLISGRAEILCLHRCWWTMLNS